MTKEKRLGVLGSGCSSKQEAAPSGAAIHIGWQLFTALQLAQEELQRRAHMPKVGSFDRTAPGQLAEGAGARRRRRVPERIPKSPDK